MTIESSDDVDIWIVDGGGEHSGIYEAKSSWALKYPTTFAQFGAVLSYIPTVMFQKAIAGLGRPGR